MTYVYHCTVCGEELNPCQTHRESDCAIRLAAFARLRMSNEMLGLHKEVRQTQEPREERR